MRPVLVLAGAMLTIAASLAAGLLLFQRLRLRLYRQEVLPYAFVTGSALFSSLVFLLTAAQLAYAWTFGITGMTLVGAAVVSGAWKRTEPKLPPLPAGWRALFASGLLVYGGYVYLSWAMAPENSPDGATYHLGLVARYLRQHGFGWITTNMYANVSMGVEMLYLSAFSIGRHSSAAVVHLAFLITLPLLMLSFAQRHNIGTVGVTAALLVFCSPVIGVDGSTAYIDVAMAAVVFASFCMIQIWSRERDNRLLIPAGLLAGFAYACKMTAFAAVPYALGVIVYTLVRDRLRTREALKPLLVTTLCAASMIAPWMIKNAIVVGNPFSPFLNRLFENPYVRISFEEEYRSIMRNYGELKSPAEIPIEVTVRGGKLNGLLGPVFLLAPIALIALRWRLGRQVVLAGAIFAATYPMNVGTRFLIAAVPFLAFAMAMVLVQWRVAAPVVLFHAVASWPAFIGYYCDPYAWKMDRARWRAALRRVSEDEFLRQTLPGYAMAKLIDQHVPPNGKVLSYHGAAEAYLERELLVCYVGGLNNMLCEMWASGTERYFLPSRHWNFRSEETTARRVRLVQTATSSDVWSVSEFRVYGPRGEIPRSPRWSVKASPNPWDVQLAFDNCFVTRWKSWQRARPGMYLELDFGEPLKINAAVAEIPADNPTTSGRLEVQVEADRWTTLVAAPEETPAPDRTNARRTAIEDLKRYGITYLAVGTGEFLERDMFRNREAWGTTLVGETSDGKLYRID